jgi:hypothetical protein
MLNFLYNTGIRRCSEVLCFICDMTGKSCVLEEFSLFDRIFHKMEKPISVWNAYPLNVLYTIGLTSQTNLST